MTEPTPEIGLLEASSLGRPNVLARAGSVPAEAVTRVLTGLARLDARVAEARGAPAEVVAVDGPRAAWRREFDRVLAEAGPPPVRAVVGDGVPAEEIAARALANVEVAHALIRAVGGDWASHRRLLRAARVEAGLEESRPTARRSVSGFTSALHSTGPRRALAPPIDTLPIVRGRDRLVARLLEAAAEPGGPTTVLVGEAGLGKSTTALAVAREAGKRPVVTLWIVAHDGPALVDGLQQVALRLGVTARDLEVADDIPPETRALRLWELIDRRPHRWLLVIDDAGPAAVGAPAWLPRPRHGTVLITSRYGDQLAWRRDADVVPMDRLEPEHGARLLLDIIAPAEQRLSAGVHAQARRASELIGGIPVALTSLGALVRSGGAGALDGLVATLTLQPSLDALATAYALCLDAAGELDADTASARRTLRLLSCFAADEPLPRHLLDTAPESDEVAVLVRVGLVESRATVDGEALVVQTAVAEHARRDSAFGPLDVAALNRQALALLGTEYGRIDPGAPRDWPAVSILAPHVAEVLESSTASRGNETAEDALWLAARASECLMRVGDHTAGTTLLDRALARFSWLAPDRPVVLASRRIRAWMIALDNGGDLRRAGQRLVGLLAETRDVLGPENPVTLTVQDTLGSVRAEQGDLALGRTLLDEVLRIRRRLLGDADPATLATRHRLAWITANQGRPEQAAETLTEVLAARRALLGNDHLDVYGTRYRLAFALNEQGRHAEATRTYQELIDDLEANLGARHPLTLMTRGRLAWALSSLNRFEDAETCYAELLEDQEKVLGVDHPRVFTTGHYLAMLWLARGRVAQAEIRFDEVAARRAEVLGGDHPLTLLSRSCHAWARFRLGADVEAERELQAVFADRVGVLGERHPDTLITRALLARILLHRGRLAEAEKRLRALLVDMTEVFAPDHRHVLETRMALATAVGFADNLVEADEIIQSVIADRVRTLGLEHRDTLTARDGLCWVLGRGGRLAEASRECGAVLDARRRTLGEHHPATLTSRYREAWIVLRDGRHTEARHRFARLLVDLRRTAGDRHPETLRCRIRYVETLRVGQRWAEAEHNATSLVDDLITVLGQDAVETMRGREEMGWIAAARGRSEEARWVLDDVLDRRRRVLGPDHADTLASVEDLENLR